MTRQMCLVLSVLLFIPSVFTAQSPAPPARTGHVMTTAGATGGVLLLGGAVEPGDKLWRLAGRGWESLGTGGPVNRSMIAAAYDTRRGVLVGFGGIGPRNGSRYGETWEWDGKEWRERDVRSPGSRDHHAMAFDEARGQVVMFGGWDINKVFQPDTWTWDGTAWAKADSSTGPGGLGHLAMAYDRRRQRVVLFGGDGPDKPATSDTWEWDGARWERVATTGPEPRTRHRLAYDAARGVTVMFGGQIGSGPSSVYPQDVWTWNGRTWTRMVAAGPSPRYMPAMAYDERRERVIMSGGSLGARPFSALSDTWEWDGSAWKESK